MKLQWGWPVRAKQKAGGKTSGFSLITLDSVNCEPRSADLAPHYRDKADASPGLSTQIVR
jgi:hypothetical protein